MTNTMNKEQREDAVTDLVRAGTFNDACIAFRDWAQDKGFEDDMGELYRAVSMGCTAAGMSLETKTEHLRKLARYFALAQVGLIISELGEAVEQIRKPAADDHLPHFAGVVTELADTVIRIGHMWACMHKQAEYTQHGSMDLGEAILAKHKYNEQRPYKHNKKA